MFLKFVKLNFIVGLDPGDSNSPLSSCCAYRPVLRVPACPARTGLLCAYRPAEGSGGGGTGLSQDARGYQIGSLGAIRVRSLGAIRYRSLGAINSRAF